MASFADTDPRISLPASELQPLFPVPRVPDLRRPGLLDVLKSDIQNNNVVSAVRNGVDLFMSGLSEGRDPGFNVFETDGDGEFIHFPGLSPFMNRFVGVKNARQAGFIREQINREIANEEVLSRASTLQGFASTFLAQVVTDPISWVGIGAEAALFKAGAGSFAKGASIAAGAAFPTELARESVLQKFSQTRTTQRSVVNITGATALSGLFGGVGSALVERSVRRQANNIIEAGLSPEGASKNKIPSPDDVPGASESLVRSVDEFDDVVADPDSGATMVSGGASKAQVDNLLKELADNDVPQTEIDDRVLGRIPFLSRVFRSISPTVAGLSSDSKIVKRAMHLLVNSPLKVKGLAAGNAENEVNAMIGKFRVTQDKVTDLYAQHLTAGQRTSAGVLTRLDLSRTPRGKLTQSQFNAEVASSLRAGTDHGKAIAEGLSSMTEPIEEVTRAARIYREEVFNPLLERARDAGLFSKDLTDEQISRYLNRVYDPEKLDNAAQRAGLERALADHFQSVDPKLGRDAAIEEAKKAVARARRINPVRGAHPLRRSALLDRSLDVPDSVVAPWLINDVNRLASTYVRSVGSDVALAKRFGIKPTIDALDNTRLSTIKSIRSDPDGAVKILSDRDTEILESTVPAGRGRDAMASAFDTGKTKISFEDDVIEGASVGRDDLIDLIRSADTEDEALRLLNQRDNGLVERFHGADLRIVRENIDEAYERLIKASDSSGQRSKLERAWRRDKEALDLNLHHVRGTHYVGDPLSTSSRVLRGIRNFTFLTLGGGITLSSLGEPIIAMLNTGPGRVFRTQYESMLTESGRIVSKMTRSDLESLGLSFSIVDSTRAKSLFDLQDEFVPTTALERGLERSTEIFSVANLITPWTSRIKLLAGSSSLDMIIESARKVKAGRNLKGDISNRLADLGLDRKKLALIHDQWDKHAPTVDGSKHNRVLGFDRWDDPAARDLMEQAMGRSTSLNVIMGSPGSRPNIPGLSTEVSRFIFMFRNFALSSTTRIAGRALQFSDATAASAFMLSLTAAMMIDILKRGSAGRDMPEDLGEWFRSSMHRSEFSGIFFDVSGIINQATRGNWALVPVVGATESPRRFHDPASILGAILGPAFSQTLSAANIVVDAADGDFQPRSARDFVKLTPGNTMIGFQRIFNSLGDELSDRATDRGASP